MMVFRGRKAMNEKTAQHLNELRRQATPLQLTGNLVPHGGTEDTRRQLQERLHPIFEAAKPEALRQEIIEAAKEMREAETNCPEFTCYSWEHYRNKQIPWELTRRLWFLCGDQILAAVKALNEETESQYETYRLACEQGVAVPPPQG
jgi:hypothetical protein